MSPSGGGARPAPWRDDAGTAQVVAAALAGAGARLGLVTATAPVAEPGRREAERRATDELAARLVTSVRATLPGSAGACRRGGPAIGGVPAPVARSATGRPRWPEGVVGSLAHAGAVAVGIAGARASCRAVGLDIEHAAALPVDDAAVVLDDRERRWAGAGADADARATWLWCAKEAAFKAWCGALDDDLPGVEPLDVVVLPGIDAGTFAVRAGGALAARVQAVGPLSGRWLALDAGMVLTITWR